MGDTCESGRGQNIPNKAEWRRMGKRGGKVTRSRGLLRFNTVSERRTCALTEQQSKSTRVWLRQSTSGGMWVPVCMQNQLDFLLGQPCAARQSADPQSGWFLFLISTFFLLGFHPQPLSLLCWIFSFAPKEPPTVSLPASRTLLTPFGL